MAIRRVCTLLCYNPGNDAFLFYEMIINFGLTTVSVPWSIRMEISFQFKTPKNQHQTRAVLVK